MFDFCAVKNKIEYFNVTFKLNRIDLKVHISGKVNIGLNEMSIPWMRIDDVVWKVHRCRVTGIEGQRTIDEIPNTQHGKTRHSGGDFILL